MPEPSRSCAPPLAPRYRRRQPENTVLHRVVRDRLETFLHRQRDRGRPVPRFVERELRGFLECGILAHGFVRVHCDACGKDRLVAFSCKGRGFCPSCGGRRMADTAAWLVDRVLPEVPVRQWVLTLPFPLRFRMAYDARLTSAVLRIFLRAVFASLRRRARREGARGPLSCGAVTFVQRFGDALNLNVHFHTLVLDGVHEPFEGRERFRPLPPPDRREMERILRRIARQLERLLEREGFEVELLAADQPLLAGLAGASIRGRIATGRRAGRGVLRRGDRIDPEDLADPEKPFCVAAAGFSLHAGVCVPARDRRRLERLCRYVGRPPVSTSRLSKLPDGRLLYALKHRWRDGTTHVVFEPDELLEKLVSLVPPPRAHQVRYHGVLAPCASRRADVVPAATPDVLPEIEAPPLGNREGPGPPDDAQASALRDLSRDARPPAGPSLEAARPRGHLSRPPARPGSALRELPAGCPGRS